MMETRTESQILSAQIPGVESISLGGKLYAVKEPSLIRVANIMAIQGEYQDLQGRVDTLTGVEQMTLLNSIMVRMVREFSAEIDSDWSRIETEATAEELLVAVETVSRVVSAPFMRRALAASAPPNRETRRTKTKKR